jgi:hypothetical protein
VAYTSSYTDPQHRSQPGSEAMDLGARAWDRAATAGEAARESVKEHPIVTVAVIAGLAFAIGALWKIGRPRQPSRVEALLSRLAELPTDLPRRWRS